MTADKILQRYVGTGRDEPESLAKEEGEVDDLGSFGWLRGIRDRAVTLEFRLKNGNSVAFDFGWLRKVEYNPSDGLVLHFGGDAVVKITGRNLNRPTRPGVQLLRGILAHRVLWIQEADEPTAMAAAKDATVIERVEIS